LMTWSSTFSISSPRTCNSSPKYSLTYLGNPRDDGWENGLE
jgi:hypothetical protein